MALVLAGCSSRNDSYATAADPRVAAPPRYEGRTAVAVAPEQEMEADGLPAQRPPLMSRNKRAVDPSEPFSPNYGAPAQSAMSNKTADALPPERETDRARVMAVSVRDLPDDLPPDFRERLIVVNGLR